MEKKTYDRPMMKCIRLKHTARLMAASGDPVRNVPWWDGEGGAKGGNVYFEDDEEDDFIPPKVDFSI